MKVKGERRKVTKSDLKDRLKAFALRIIALYGALPKTTEAQVIGKQLLRSGTSVGAQYYEAQRAKSDADFISKIDGAAQECEETCYWLELLQGAGIVPAERLSDLCNEAQQLIAILVTIARKVKGRKEGRTS
jgi:four helix bundle protein